MQPRTLFSKLKRALAPLAGTRTTPTMREVMTAMHLRRALLDTLALPPTRHNTDRLVTWALAGLPLRTFIRDVDVFFPDAALADDGLFLASMSAHCAHRRVLTKRARRAECAALLRLDPATRAPLIDALLDGMLTPSAVLLLARSPAPNA